jgi:hypothetical protein
MMQFFLKCQAKEVLMSGITLITKPDDEPVSLSEAKEYLRIDDQVDDTLVRSLILTATEWAENQTARSLINRTLKLSIDGIQEIEESLTEGMTTAPFKQFYQNYIEIPFAPLQSVTHIKYFSDTDVESTWATSNYYVDTVREPARVVLRDGGTYPTDLRNANGIEVTFVAGYGENPTDVPEAIRVAILQYITFLYEHRGDFERFPPPKLPSVLNQLLQPYKIVRFSNSSFRQKYMAGY